MFRRDRFVMILLFWRQWTTQFYNTTIQESRRAFHKQCFTWDKWLYSGVLEEANTKTRAVWIRKDKIKLINATKKRTITNLNRMVIILLLKHCFATCINFDFVSFLCFSPRKYQWTVLNRKYVPCLQICELRKYIYCLTYFSSFVPLERSPTAKYHTCSWPARGSIYLRIIALNSLIPRAQLRFF